jgi:hypothetical protein
MIGKVLLSTAALGALLAGVVVPAAATGAGAGQPQRAPAASRPVPKVPLVIDGQRMQPTEINRFDGQPLYLIVDQRNPDVLVGYTDEAKAKAAIAGQRPAVAPTSSGQSVVIYSSDEGRDDAQTIWSGWGINNLSAAARGCGLFGCAGDWNDVISSALMNGTATFYTDPNYGGGWLYAWGGNWRFNMSTYGFDNVVSSLNAWW